MLRTAAILGVVLCLILPLHAQQAPTPAPPPAPPSDAPAQSSVTAAVTGQVHTAGGVAIPGANLRLIETSSGRAFVSWTDDNGRFNLPGLPPGHYRIDYGQLGFDSATQEFDLSEAGTAPLNLTLRVASLESIEAAAQPAPAPNPATAAPAAPGTTPAAAPANPPASAAGGVPARAPGNRPGGGNGNRAAGAGGGANGARPGGAGPGRQGGGARGFQQVQLNNEGGGAEAEAGGGEAEAAAGGGGEAGADATLLAGTVSQGQDVSTPTGGGPGPGGGPPGGGGPGAGPGGFPGGGGGAVGANPFGGAGGAGAAPGMNIRVGGAGGGGGGGRGRGPGGGAPPAGAGALYGMQRVLRQRANQIHFSVYDQYSNSAFNAKPYSLEGLSPIKIPTWNERTGGNIGGPLRIPHIYNGSDKTFFFVNVESAWARNAVDEYSTVPTLQERSGNFCDMVPSALAPKVTTPNIFVGSTDYGCSLRGNDPSHPQAPASLNSIAQSLLGFYPLPNVPGTGFFPDNYHLQTQVPTQNTRLNTRVLHTINSKLNARVIYNISEGNAHTFQSFPGLEASQSTRGQSVTLGLTEQINRTWMNDTQVIYSRNRTLSLSNFANVDNVSGDLGITGVSQNPLDFGPPQLGLTTYSGLASASPSLTRNQTYRLVDAVTNTRPRHTISFGGEIRSIQNNSLTDPVPEGLFTFTDALTANVVGGVPTPGTGLDAASFLLGLPTTSDLRFGSPTDSFYFRSWGFIGYAQDDWRMKPNFTLQYGIRYEGFTPPTELNGHLSDLFINADLGTTQVVVPAGANISGISTPPGVTSGSIVHGSYNNWSPRLGIAWRPPGKIFNGSHATTVRAGYGMFYNQSIYQQLVGELSNQFPWAVSELQQSNLSATSPNITLANGFPSGSTTVANNTYAVNPNYKLAYAQIYNASVETAITPNLSLSATYTGTHGTNLDMLYALNRPTPGSSTLPFPNSGNFIYDTSGGVSNFNALQVRLQKRQTRGFSFNIIYTYGKSMDDASSIGGGTPIVVQNPNNPLAEYGLSSFDVRNSVRANYYYELPFGDRHRFAQKGVSAAILGNWRLSGNIAAHSGTPFTALALPTGTFDTGGGGIFAVRADQVCDPNLSSGQRAPTAFFNTACFIVPTGEFGDAARNTIEGPGMFTWNFQIAKWFPFGADRNRRLDVRWEITNLTNTPNFIGLSTTVGSPTFGRVLSAGGMRTMDIMARVNF